MLIEDKNWDKKQEKRRASFLQSGNWGVFQESLGHVPHFVEGNGWSCLLLKKKTRLGSYLFSPYGPTLESLTAIDEALEKLKAYAKRLEVDWLRLEPIINGHEGSKLHSYLRHCGAFPAPRNVEPALTRVLNLKPTPEELLSSISQTTRNYINRNQRLSDVSFTTSANSDDVNLFVDMLEMVSARKKVVFFSRGYFTKQAEILMPAKMLYLELAHYQKKVVAATLVHEFGKNGSYTYASSLPEARDLNVSALLLWQSILNARSRGVESFDLFGVAPDDAPTSHPWYGFSVFKKKFGGELIEHSGTWDIPLSPRYKLYRTATRGRMALRKLR